VKRELLRRIKNRFDKLGIEIPYPHRTVFHRDLNVRVNTGNEPS
jgi:small-conductance mechanosensitive channel